ncbi:MAG TPA: hypothetical protein VMS73_00465 [Anaerolineaceae bacterium]|nr:hypothetical protein [Anaerolineaceae bacterium]
MKFVNAGLVVFLLVILGIFGLNRISSIQKSLQSIPTTASPAQKAVSSEVIYIPAAIYTRPNPPVYSTSYYMLTVDGPTYYNMGCKLGQLDLNTPGSRDSVVVLDFGSPAKVGNEYGTDLFWMGPVTISQITAAVKNFGAGYYTCVSTDHDSKIYIALGTTNYHTKISNTADFANHGSAWARMVNDLNTWFSGQGYAGQVLAVGANDIELSWNTPAITKAWVNGYNAAHKYDWYDFGTLDGCAVRSYPDYAKCGNGWTREDAWYVVYGTRPAWPLPEIYMTSGLNAQQWALLSRYSYTAKRYPFIFVGVFTQMQACAQAPGQCAGVDNTPAAGWNQLYDELRRDPNTGFTPPLSSDIKWWNGIATLNSTNQPQAQTTPFYSIDFYQTIADNVQSALRTPSLIEESRTLLLGKLANAQRVLDLQAAVKPASKGAKALPALPKVIDPDFQIGVFDGPGGVFHAFEGDFNNHWQGQVGLQFVFVSAGSSADDPSQGIVAVVTVSGDRLNVTKKVYPAPSGSGSLQVKQVQWPSVQLKSQNGQLFKFDAAQEKFVQ